MRTKRFVAIALSTCSILGCDNIFEEKDATGESRNSVVPEVAPSPVSEITPQESQRNSSWRPADDTPAAEEAPLENDLTPEYEIAFIENNEIRDFSSWLHTPEGSDQVATVGRYKRFENELNLNRDALMSFSSFANDKPLRIRTHGHKLILIGHSMNNLFIETKGEDKSSGDVIVFITSPELPTINTQGKDGRNGKNAECRDVAHSCVEISDRTSRRSRLRESFDWRIEEREARYSWRDSTLSQEIRDRINALVRDRPPEQFSNDICGTGVTLHINISKPELEGELLLKQKIKFPIRGASSMDDNAPQAHLVEGEPGENGQNAGNVRIFQLSKHKRQIESVVLGGTAGSGGRNLKIPAAEATEEIVLKSEVIEEQIYLKNLIAKRTVIASCVSELGRHPRSVYRVYSESFHPDSASIKTNMSLDRHTLTLISRNAGEDLDSQTPEVMRSGAAGKNALAKWTSVQSWQNWRKLIPNEIALPKAVLDHSLPAASGGRLSGDVLGLRTLPL